MVKNIIQFIYKGLTHPKTQKLFLKILQKINYIILYLLSKRIGKHRKYRHLFVFIFMTLLFFLYSKNSKEQVVVSAPDVTGSVAALTKLVAVQNEYVNATNTSFFTNLIASTADIFTSTEKLNQIYTNANKTIRSSMRLKNIYDYVKEFDKQIAGIYQDMAQYNDFLNPSERNLMFDNLSKLAQMGTAVVNETISIIQEWQGLSDEKANNLRNIENDILTAISNIKEGRIALKKMLQRKKDYEVINKKALQTATELKKNPYSNGTVTLYFGLNDVVGTTFYWKEGNNTLLKEVQTLKTIVESERPDISESFIRKIFDDNMNEAKKDKSLGIFSQYLGVFGSNSGLRRTIAVFMAFLATASIILGTLNLFRTTVFETGVSDNEASGMDFLNKASTWFIATLFFITLLILMQYIG